MKNNYFKKSIIIPSLLATLLYGGKKANLKENHYVLIKKPAIVQSKIEKSGNSKKTNLEAKLTKKQEEDEEEKELTEEEKKMQEDLTKRFSTFKTELFFNYIKEAGPSKEPIFSRSYFYFNQGNLYPPENTQILSPSEKNQVEHILSNVQNKFIISYAEFISKTFPLSENQILSLTSVIGGKLLGQGYDSDLVREKIVSQEIFFNKFQYSLATNEDNGLGVCRHIHSHLEKFLNDNRIPAAAVVELNHVFTLARTSVGNTLFNYLGMINTNKNLEKTLEAYQKLNKKIIFEFDFYENDKFKYKFRTKEGRDFLKLVRFDPSTKSIRDLLIEDIIPEPDLKIGLDKGNYSYSGEFNLLGFFLRQGRMWSTSSNPLNRIDFIQYGFKRKFPFFLDYVKFDLDINFVKGYLYEELITRDNNKNYSGYKINGANTNFAIATNFKEGLNGSFRLASTHLSVEDYIKNNEGMPKELLSDEPVEFGISYKIPYKPAPYLSNKKIIFTPYSILQISSSRYDLSNGSGKQWISEIRSGISSNAYLTNKIKFSLDPHYIKRFWEHGYGLGAKLGNNYIKISFEGEKTESDYVFNANKIKYGAGLSIDLGHFSAEINLKKEIHDYGGDKEKEKTINFKVSAKF